MSTNYSDFYCSARQSDSFFQEMLLAEDSLFLNKMRQIEEFSTEIREEVDLDKAVSLFLSMKGVSDRFIQKQGGDSYRSARLETLQKHVDREEEHLVQRMVVAYRQDRASFGSFLSKMFLETLDQDLECNRKILIERLSEELFNQMDRSERREALISLFEKSFSFVVEIKSYILFAADLGSLTAYLTKRFNLEDPSIDRMQRFYEEYVCETLADLCCKDLRFKNSLNEDPLKKSRFSYAVQRMDSFWERLDQAIRRREERETISFESHSVHSLPQSHQTVILQGKEYTIEREIAKGTSARIFTAVEKTSGKRVAIKAFITFSNDRITKEMIAMELLAMRGGHPMVVASFGSPLVRWHQGARHSRCIIMDYVDGVEFQEWDADSEQRKRVRQEIDGAYQFLEELGIKICDTHGGNQMVTSDGHPVLIDIDPDALP